MAAGTQPAILAFLFHVTWALRLQRGNQQGSASLDGDAQSDDPANGDSMQHISNAVTSVESLLHAEANKKGKHHGPVHGDSMQQISDATSSVESLLRAVAHINGKHYGPANDDPMQQVDSAVTSVDYLLRTAGRNTEIHNLTDALINAQKDLADKEAELKSLQDKLKRAGKWKSVLTTLGGAEMSEDEARKAAAQKERESLEQQISELPKQIQAAKDEKIKKELAAISEADDAKEQAERKVQGLADKLEGVNSQIASAYLHQDGIVQKAADEVAELGCGKAAESIAKAWSEQLRIVKREVGRAATKATEVAVAQQEETKKIDELESEETAAEDSNGFVAKTKGFFKAIKNKMSKAKGDLAREKQEDGEAEKDLQKGQAYHKKAKKMLVEKLKAAEHKCKEIDDDNERQKAEEILKKIKQELDQKNSATLKSAVEAGDAMTVEQQLAAGVDVNDDLDEKGNRALHLAVQQGQQEVVKALLKAPGVDVLQKNHNGQTAEQLAGENRQDIVMTLKYAQAANAALLEKATSQWFRGQDAVTEKFKEVLEMPEANVNAALDEDHNTALHLAIRKKENKAIIALLAIPGIDVNVEDLKGHTALQLVIAVDFKIWMARKGILGMILTKDVNEDNLQRAVDLAKEKGDAHIVHMLTEAKEQQSQKATETTE
eukprot:gnl/TRDRNA2_/TRDRNA2_152133_c0_seq1.p1 gnl/TRDRNA2_/TRDRNA2_152133_c0~~gnl/TRDRNA2_/TRDRNA2_152133_c0_seq1.p1  ORF type:complete len:663 (-),score=182.21 gnl/TRDRNA2_/TRDRNA2_152133_c0_seq1:123-2111(-)